MAALDLLASDECLGRRAATQRGPFFSIQNEGESMTEQQIEAMQKMIGDREAEIKLLNDQVAALRQGIIRTALRAAAKEAGVRPEAMDDVFARGEKIFEVSPDGFAATKANCGVSPGVDAASWLTEMRPRCGHWFSANEKEIAPAANPWLKANWNLTEQGKVIRADEKHKTNVAERLAAAAGVKVGATRPVR
jgi:hypothetical protein